MSPRRTTVKTDSVVIKYDPNNPEKSFQKVADALLNLNRYVKNMSQKIAAIENKIERSL